MEDAVLIDIFKLNTDLLDEILNSIGLEELTPRDETPPI